MSYRYSIIVSFYNSEKYVLRTMNNLKRIINDNIEIIIVDDGSTDNTLSIINKYNLKNSKIISQDNAGVSSARNTGLKHANGKYILFLDGDDWLDEDIFHKLDEYYEYNYDLIKFGFVFTDLINYNKYEVVDQDKMIKKEDNQIIINKMLSTNKFNSVCNQIIKKEVLINNNIKFEDGRKYAEDFQFNLKLIRYIENMYIFNDCLYYYYENKTSTTRSYDKDNVLKCLNDALDIYISSLKYYKKTNKERIEYTSIINRIYKEITSCLKKIYFINNIKVIEINSIFDSLYENNQYKTLELEINKCNYHSKDIFDRAVFTKRIYSLNFLLLMFCKLKIKIFKHIKRKK